MRVPLLMSRPRRTLRHHVIRTRQEDVSPARAIDRRSLTRPPVVSLLPTQP